MENFSGVTQSKKFDPQRFKSFWNYIQIILSLISGYVLGIFFTFGVQYLDALPFLSNQKARFALVLAGMGMLGATIYCSKYWADDIQEAMENPQLLPHYFDFFGYITTIIGGGITGVVLYFFILISEIAITENPRIRLETALIISFSGGFSSFKVLEALKGFIDKLLKQHDRASEDKAAG